VGSSPVRRGFGPLPERLHDRLVQSHQTPRHTHHFTTASSPSPPQPPHTPQDRLQGGSPSRQAGRESSEDQRQRHGGPDREPAHPPSAVALSRSPNAFTTGSSKVIKHPAHTHLTPISTFITIPPPTATHTHTFGCRVVHASEQAGHESLEGPGERHGGPDREPAHHPSAVRFFRSSNAFTTGSSRVVKHPAKPPTTPPPHHLPSSPPPAATHMQNPRLMDHNLDDQIVQALGERDKATVGLALLVQMLHDGVIKTKGPSGADSACVWRGVWTVGWWRGLYDKTVATPGPPPPLSASLPPPSTPPRFETHTIQTQTQTQNPPNSALGVSYTAHQDPHTRSSPHIASPKPLSIPPKIPHTPTLTQMPLLQSR
jgi:hypothetical protein